MLGLMQSLVLTVSHLNYSSMYAVYKIGFENLHSTRLCLSFKLQKAAFLRAYLIPAVPAI